MDSLPAELSGKPKNVGVGSLSLFQGLFLADLPGGSDGKASAYNVGDPVLSLGGEDPPEKEMATHSSTLAWEIPCTEPAGL